MILFFCPFYYIAPYYVCIEKSGEGGKGQGRGGGKGRGEEEGGEGKKAGGKGGGRGGEGKLLCCFLLVICFREFRWGGDTKIICVDIKNILAGRETQFSYFLEP